MSGLTALSMSRAQSGNRARNLSLFGLGWGLLLFGGVSYWFVLQPVLRDGRDQDFLFFYMGARIGLEHGWPHLYDLSLQHSLFAQLRPGHGLDVVSTFVAPPPLAWLAVPFTVLPIPVGFLAWDTLQMVCLLVAWKLAAPGDLSFRLVLLIASVAWYPVVVAFRTGQPSFFVLFFLTASWYMLQRGRQWQAGGLLALTAIKPTMVLLVGPALFLAGYRRAFVAWALASGALAAVSLALLGPYGTHWYIDILATTHTVTGARELTLAAVLGPGELATGAQLAVAFFTLAVAWRQGLNRPADLFAAAIVGSLLSAPYLHAHDAPVLLLAFWLWLRRPLHVGEAALLLATALAYELVNVVGPLPILGVLAIWLGLSFVRTTLDAPEVDPASR